MSTTSAPTPEVLKQKLGCPDFYEPLLGQINDQRRTIKTAVTNFLTLPYVNAIKVTDSTGKEVSLYHQVTKLLSIYNALEVSTVQIVQNIGAYGSIMKITLPGVAGSGEYDLTLEEFLLVVRPLVSNYSKEARSLADKAHELLRAFQDILITLRQNLLEVLERLRKQEEDLEEAEEQYDAQKKAAIFAGIVAGIYLIGAAIALALGDPPGAMEFANEALPYIIDAVEATIKTIGLAGVIRNLKNAIETSIQTKNNLETLIPALETNVEVVGRIGQAWDVMAISLAEIADDQRLWSDPALYTGEMLKPTLDSWTSVQIAIDVFVGLESGTASVGSTADKMQSATMATTTSERLEVTVSVSVALAFQLQSAGFEIAERIYSAPDLKGQVIRPQDLETIQSSYQDISNQLAASLGQGNISRQANDIAIYTRDQVKPSVTAASTDLKKFAAVQPVIPPKPISEADWHTFYTTRMTQLQSGRDKSKVAYEATHSIQYKSDSLNIDLEQRYFELRAENDAAYRRMQEIQRELARLNELLRKFPFAGAIIAAIKLATGELQEMQRSLRELDSKLYTTMKMMSACGEARKKTGELASLAQATEQFWVDLYNKLYISAETWPVLKDLELLPPQIKLFNETWEVVRQALRDW